MKRLSVVALLLAGCGSGGGSDDSVNTAVSATPPPASQSTVVSETPSESPLSKLDEVLSTPIPPMTSGSEELVEEIRQRVDGPPPGPPAVETPPDTAIVAPTVPAPTLATVSGPLVWAALQTGISKDPAPESPYSDDRAVKMEDGGTYRLGGAMDSYSLAQSPWGPIMVANRVTVNPSASNGVIFSIEANGLQLEGNTLDLRNTNPVMDTVAGSWTKGEWFAKLIIQSQGSLMRVCWNVHLPAPEPVYGPPDVEPAVRLPVFKRLMCGVYSRTQPGKDLGGYVVDDFAGTIRTFRGSW